MPTRVTGGPSPAFVPGSSPVLRPGAQGAEVSGLQRLLTEKGFGVPDTGNFGPQTEAAVRRFQAAAGLRVDGQVGPETWRALRSFRVDVVDPPVPPAAPSPDEADWQRYAAMVRAAGGLVNPGGRPTVLGLRTQTDRSTAFRDQLVVLTADHRVRVFNGSTVPSMRNSSDAPDINRDGIYDVGVIKPGNYQVGPHREFMGGPSFSLNGAGPVPGWRDTDGDGLYSVEEKRASEARGDTLSGVLFHRGMPDRPVSVGCVTMAPDVFDQFFAAVGGRDARFNFTLVDAP